MKSQVFEPSRQKKEVEKERIDSQRLEAGVDEDYKVLISTYQKRVRDTLMPYEGRLYVNYLIEALCGRDCIQGT